MIELYDNETGELVAQISFEQFRLLADEAGAGTDSDRDFVVDEALVAHFESEAFDDELTEILYAALGSAEAVELRCELPQ